MCTSWQVKVKLKVVGVCAGIYCGVWVRPEKSTRPGVAVKVKLKVVGVCAGICCGVWVRPGKLSRRLTAS